MTLALSVAPIAVEENMETGLARERGCMVGRFELQQLCIKDSVGIIKGGKGNSSGTTLTNVCEFDIKLAKLNICSM